MVWNVIGAGLPLAMLMIAAGPAFAHAPPATGNMAQATATTPVEKQASIPAPSLVPADFKVPTLVETADFKVLPLGPDVVTLDFDAYMSSIEHLQKTFTRSAKWPHKDISQSDAMRDMEAEQARFRSRRSFAYSVLTPDGKRERGSVYVSPSSVRGYDAVVRMWVTQDDYDAGFDAELYEWVAHWIRTDWPFAKVAYPGRAIDWGTWDYMVAGNNSGRSSSEK
jgi:hypothetical protein